MRYNPEVGKIVASFHLARIQKLMKEVENDPNCKIEVGGSNHIYTEDNYVTPTIYSNPPLNSTMMTEEIFAPILPILSFVEFDEVINKHIRTKGKPLAIYYFGNHGKNWQTILDTTSSGNATLNDILFQTLAIDNGFGGVGASGMGRYGGREGFKQWSNPKAVVEKKQLNFWPITWFAPPWTDNKKRFIRTLLGGLWLKQNQIMFLVMKLVVGVLAFQLLFGNLGQSQLRKDVYSSAIAFLKEYAN